MLNNLRFELSFKNILQLENILNFCLYNKINKINIPCKGLIKKEFLNETVEYIGENYKELEVIYHYSLYHQYTKNRENSYLEFLNFIRKCISYNNKEILLVSGSNKKKNFEVIDVLNDFKNEKTLNINIGIAYNPYLKKYFNLSGERLRFENKISSGLTKSIWLQFGTDIKLLEYELKYLKKFISNNSYNINVHDVKFYGSLLIPSKQFISRFKFRPWKGVYISDNYLNSIYDFHRFSQDLIAFYLDNNIYPVIETEFASIEKLEDIYTLLKI
mgnify:CR=1 FL=1|tara:strand:- start:412 stop:1230 length:819 start_codon:yes stop_codon:yes gene_type:complete